MPLTEPEPEPEPVHEQSRDRDRARAGFEQHLSGGMRRLVVFGFLVVGGGLKGESSVNIQIYIGLWERCMWVFGKNC